jgi:hypothetical protein
MTKGGKKIGNLLLPGLRGRFGAGLALVLLASFLHYTAIPARSADALVPSFGRGKVQVRLYTDYFCGPCSRMEPRVETLLSDLVRKNAITLTFIDTPVHSFTPLYAKYFLYIAKGDPSFPSVLRARNVLFEAARDKIEEQVGLEEFLRKNNVRYREFDPRPIQLALSALIREDNVRSTPTCVIIKDGKRGVFTGDIEIPKALELLN